MLGDPGHQELASFLTKTTQYRDSPEAKIIVSAHWEEDVPTVTGSPSPELLYDYFGFPEESYRIKCPAYGDTALAGEVSDLLVSGGFNPVTDKDRGFDHSMFIPLMLMYPEAVMPNTGMNNSTAG